MSDVTQEDKTDPTAYTMEAEFEYRFGSEDSLSDEQEAAFDSALKRSTAELYSLGLRDVGIARDKAARRFWMTVLVQNDGDYLDKVVSETWSTLRTAFHAAGIATPGWPQATEASTVVKMRSLKAAEKELVPV